MQNTCRPGVKTWHINVLRSNHLNQTGLPTRKTRSLTDSPTKMRSLSSSHFQPLISPVTLSLNHLPIVWVRDIPRSGSEFDPPGSGAAGEAGVRSPPYSSGAANPTAKQIGGREVSDPATPAGKRLAITNVFLYRAIRLGNIYIYILQYVHIFYAHKRNSVDMNQNTTLSLSLPCTMFFTSTFGRQACKQLIARKIELWNHRFRPTSIPI